MVKIERFGIRAGGLRLSEMKTGPGIKGHAMKSKMNFDEYLAEQLKDKNFAEHFERAGKAWDLAIRLAPLKEKTRLLQKE
jgi:hypothetical protein